MWKPMPLPEGDTGDPRWQAAIEIIGHASRAGQEEKISTACDVILEHAAELSPLHREMLTLYRASVRPGKRTVEPDEDEDVTGHMRLRQQHAVSINWSFAIGCLLVAGLVLLLWAARR